MKLPTGDGDLTEDEFEGLVSSNAPQSHSHSSPRSFRSGRSSAWARSSVSSRSVGNQKRVLVFLGFLVLVLGMIGLSHTDSEAVSLNNNTSMDPSPPDYLKENIDNGDDDGDGDGDGDDGESDQITITITITITRKLSRTMVIHPPRTIRRRKPVDPTMTMMARRRKTQMKTKKKNMSLRQRKQKTKQNKKHLNNGPTMTMMPMMPRR